MAGPALAIAVAGGSHVEYPLTSRSPLSATEGGPSVLIDHAMQMLGVSRRTVYYWIRQGRLRTVRTRLGSQRVLLTSIRQMGAAAPVGSPHAAGSAGGFTS
jgi:excisionase family DNA binding protein